MSERREQSLDSADEAVRRAYRALPDDEVPPALDARVLQAASAALNERRKPAWLRWSAPIALAASVLVVVAIVLDPGARKQAEVMQSFKVRDAAAPPPPAAAPIEPTPRESTSPMESVPLPNAASSAQPNVPESKPEATANAQGNVEVTSRRHKDAVQDVPMAVTATHEEVAAERDAVAQSADAASRSLEEQRVVNDAKLNRELSTLARESPPPAASTKTQAMPVPAPAAAPRERQEIQMTGAGMPDTKVDAWLRNIVKLQTAGDDERAEREIEKLRKAYPGLDIPAALERLRRQEVGKP